MAGKIEKTIIIGSLPGLWSSELFYFPAEQIFIVIVVWYGQGKAKEVEE